MTVFQKQCLLAYLGYYEGEMDGQWGPLTEGATEAFQADYGLTVDGVYGDGTHAKASEVIASKEKSVIQKRREEAAQVPSGPQEEPDPEFWNTIEYFDRSEFRCPCPRCGGYPVEPDHEMVRVVDEIRRRLGSPITIVPGGSGIRCPEHNTEVGGVWNSRHLFGDAADLHPQKATPAQLHKVAVEVTAEMIPGRGGIGLYNWGVHVDTGKLSRWNG